MRGENLGNVIFVHAFQFCKCVWIVLNESYSPCGCVNTYVPDCRLLAIPDHLDIPSSITSPYGSLQHHNAPPSFKRHVSVSKGKDSLLLPYLKEQG